MTKPIFFFLSQISKYIASEAPSLQASSAVQRFKERKKDSLQTPYTEFVIYEYLVELVGGVHCR